MITWQPSSTDYQAALAHLRTQTKIQEADGLWVKKKAGIGWQPGYEDTIMQHWRRDNSGPYAPISPRTAEFALRNPTDLDRLGLQLRAKMGSESLPIARGVRQQTVTTDSGTPLTIYFPQQIDKCDEPIVFIHGGGWVGGAPLVPAHFLQHLAELSNRPVINIDYALAPEKKGAWAVKECYHCLEWLQTASKELFNHAYQAFMLGGDSAGGNLATGVAYLDQKAGSRLVNRLFLCYPVLTMNPEQTAELTPSFATYQVKQADVANKLKNDLAQAVPGIKLMQALYAGGENIDEPIFSPLMMTDQQMTTFVPTLMITDEFDALREQGHYFAQRLAASGVKTRYIQYQGQEHAFLDKYGILPQGEDASYEIVDWLAQAPDLSKY